MLVYHSNSSKDIITTWLSYTYPTMKNLSISGRQKTPTSDIPVLKSLKFVTLEKSTDLQPTSLSLSIKHFHKIQTCQFKEISTLFNNRAHTDTSLCNQDKTALVSMLIISQYCYQKRTEISISTYSVKFYALKRKYLKCIPNSSKIT